MNLLGWFFKQSHCLLKSLSPCFLATTVFALLLPGVTQPLRGEDTPPAKVSVVLDNNYPPYTFLDGDGQLQGILIDRWHLWERKTGIPVELHGLDWGEAIRQMRAGKFDVIDTIFKTEERSAYLDFSEPHTRIEVPIFFHKSISGITDLKSIRDFPVAVKEGDAAVSLLKDAGVSAPRLYKNYESIIHAAKLHQAQVFVVDKPAALYFLNKEDIETEYQQTEPVNVGEFHRAVAKGRGNLLATIEKGFAAITAKEYAAIDRKWFGTATGSAMPFKLLLALSIFALVVVTILIIWNQSLRWQVEKRTSALRESEIRFRKSLDFMPMPLGISDERGSILFFNREFTDRFGYTTQDTPTMAEWLLLAYPDKVYREQVLPQWNHDVEQAIMQDSTTQKRMYRITCKDGTQREVEIISRPSGGLNLTAFNDVTERNRTERELKYSEVRYRRLHETMQDAFARIEMSGRIVEANRSFREMLGYDNEELDRLSYNQITPEKWHAAEANIIETQVLERGYSDVYEKEYVRKDGNVIPVELRTFLLRDDAGQPSGMWAIVRETTERKKMESQLIQAQKMEAIGQLAGGVAHDFNNILASILLNISLLQTEPSLEEPVRRSLLEMRNEVGRAAGLTQQLLAFSRRQTMNMAPLALDALLSNSLEMLRRLLGEQIRIEFDPQDKLPTIMGNAGMLEQVVLNLCVNARDAMPHGGRLLLRTSQVFVDRSMDGNRPQSASGQYVRLSVGDTGIGMDAATCQRIFEPFFTTKELGRGTGLGLSIVFGIVKQHGGWIDVESAIGTGTSFHVYFPIAGQLAPPQSPPNPEHAEHGNGESILLVEDEDALRAILSVGLQSLGYQVQAAESPQEARALWEQHKGVFDLLLTDMIMPGGVTGLELARSLRVQKPGLKVIIASGYHKEFDDADTSSDLGMRKIHKPFGIETLSLLLRDMLTTK